MNTDYQKILTSEIKSKIWLFIVLAILCGVLVSIDKIFFSQQVIQSTIFHTEKTVKINYIYSNKSGDEFDYSMFFNSYSEIDEFLQITEDKFDYQKFNANWNNYTKIDKIKWIQKHVFINNINDGVLQYIFILAPDDPKDLSYTKEFGEQYLNEYVDFTEKKIETILPVTNFIELDHFTLEPTVNHVGKKLSIIKYASVGAFLGTLISLLIVLILAMRKYKND